MQTELVIRAQSGDIDAFSTLTSGLTDRMFAAARLILRHDEQAADAVQDALLQSWLDLRGLNDPTRFEAWLHRLLVRACYRAARRRRDRDVVELKVATAAPTVSHDAQQDVAVHDQLDRAFRRLQPEQRAVIVLHHYLGLSLIESAEILAIPLGTMQSRLNRATQLMRAAIEADERPAVLAVGVAK